MPLDRISLLVARSSADSERLKVSLLNSDRQDSAHAVAAIPRGLCLKQPQVRVTDESFVARSGRRAMKRWAGVAGFLVFPRSRIAFALWEMPMAFSGAQTRLKRSHGRLSAFAPQKALTMRGMSVGGLARLLPRRRLVFFPFGARGGGASRLGKHQRFSRQVQWALPPPPTFAMRAAVAPFRCFFREDPEKERDGRGACRASSRSPLSGIRRRRGLRRLSRAPSSRFASEKSAARPGRARLRQDPDEGRGRVGQQPAWLSAFRAGAFRECRAGPVCCACVLETSGALGVFLMRARAVVGFDEGKRSFAAPDKCGLKAVVSPPFEAAVSLDVFFECSSGRRSPARMGMVVFFGQGVWAPFGERVDGNFRQKLRSHVLRHVRRLADDF